MDNINEIINITKFTTEFLEKEIINIIIPSIFPNLNKSDINMLGDYIIKLLNIISVCFQFDVKNRYDDHIYQLRQNNYQDIRWLIMHILPYINDNSDKGKIFYLSDIYTKKKDDVDINEKEPQYQFSNAQYNRCIRDQNNYKERPINMKKELDDSYYLLVETIYMASNKLCVNWINILPYTMKNYYESDLYLKTVKNFSDKKLLYWNPCEHTNLKKSSTEIYQLMIQNNDYLYVGHIYEAIVNLYYSIKDWKWVIYTIEIKGMLETIPNFLNLIFDDERINMKTFLEINKWEDLTNEQKEYFKSKHQYILDIINRKDSDTRFYTDTFYNFIRYFILSFEKSTYRYKAEKENYFSLRNITGKNDDDDDTDDDDDEIDKTEKFTKYDLVQCFESLESKFFYEYTAESLQKLKQTWYGFIIFNDEKTELYDGQKKEREEKISGKVNKRRNIRYKPISSKMINERFNDEIRLENTNHPQENYANNFINENPDFDLQLKNIYNFAKRFCHETEHKKEFHKLPKNWCSLIESQKKDIIERLNGLKNPLSWFSLSGYIKKFKLYSQYRELNRFKSEGADLKLKVDVVNLLAYKSIKLLLIDIVFQSLIHDGILTQFIPDKDRSELKRLPNESFDYITSIKKQQEILAENDDNKYWTDAYHYLTMKRYKDMKSYEYKQKNYTYFSMCLENPWYKAGAYDWMGQIGFCHHFINNRVIFLTAPTGIGKSTEIPKLFLYYTKVLDNNPAPKIACTQPRKGPVETAGYVSATMGIPIRVEEKDPKTENYYVQFKHSGRSHTKNVHHPILQYMTGDTLLYQINDPLLKVKIEGKKKEVYKENNLYDIIMIDESHEHVTYMDLLLTYLKLSLTMNNTIRVIIVTATMDDDEYRYRRFYRDINDNRKYPLNMFIKENKFDRVVVDRRCHVAVPTTKKGGATRYPIIEHYRPLKKDTSEDEEEMILSIVKEITTKASTGNTLIFEPGEADIKRIIQLLNKNTRADVLAIPFYSTLPDNKQDIIKKIDVYGKDIKMDKTEDFATVDHTKGTNKYNMFIIIATSIAEASITVPGLKYIIDTGTIKKPVYDYVKRADKLIKSDISESSRLQRKGRVGRTAPGEVYYLYEEDKMKSNKIQYEFSQVNISLNLFRYLKEKKEDIFPLLKTDFNKKKINVSLNNIDKKFKQVVEKQYYINEQYYNYYGSDELYDYDNYQTPPYYYSTGFDTKTLIDFDGKFYIIHPEELNLNRNINGDITGISDGNVGLAFNKVTKYKGYITSKKMTSFWKILFDYMYIGTNENDIVKTDIGNLIVKNQSKDKFILLDHNLLRTLMFGIFMNCEENILSLCAMLDSLKLDITNLFTKSLDNKSNMVNMYNKFNVESDGDVINAVIQQINNTLHKLEITPDLISDKYLQEIELKSENVNLDVQESIKLLGGEDEYTDQLKKKIDLDPKEKNKQQEKIKNIISKNYVSNIISRSQKNNNYIKNWCLQNEYDYRIILEYTKKHSQFALTINSIKNENEKEIESIKNKFGQINKITVPERISLFFGFPHNFVKKISECTYYMSLYAPSYSNMYTIAQFTPTKLKTFVKKEMLSNYLFYLLHDINKNDIGMLYHVTPKEILLLIHIYNNIFKVGENSKINFIEEQLKKYKKDNTIYKNKHINANIYKRIVNYKDTIQEIKTDFSDNSKNINENLRFIQYADPKLSECALDKIKCIELYLSRLE
jgi:Mimiviridae putative ATP-dependent RNA helicase